jgi:drug/metabolite transporter (DMT)-like permease
LSSAVLFGLSTPVSKMLLGEANPWLLAGILYVGAGFGLALVMLTGRILSLPRQEAPIRRSDLPWLAGVLVFGGLAGPLLLMLGLSTTTASSGALLLNAEGLATMAIAWLIFRENVDHRLLVGAAAILAGAVLLSWSGQGLSLDPGGLLIIAACICWGIDNNLARKLSSADPIQIGMLKGLVAGGVNLALALVAGAALPPLSAIVAGAANGFLGVGVSLVMFMLALRHLGAARTGAYFSIAPFIGAALAVALLHDPITPQLLGASALMALGLYLHVTERHEHTHVHDAMEHEHSHVHDEHHDHAHDGPVTEPHSHWHRHRPMRHSHPHFPDLHHRHSH